MSILKKLVLELNEFNQDLLLNSAPKGGAIENIFKRGRVEFSIEDSYASDYLEPWCQWVSVHTGTECQEHKIKHLGDVEKLKKQQLWDKNPELFGLVWGCLNSRTPNDKEIVYFPDPWTVSSQPTRVKVNNILKFLTFAVSKRSESGLKSTVKNILKFGLPTLFAVSRLSMHLDFFIIKSSLKLGLRNINASVIYGIVEYLTFKLAISLSSKKRPVDVIFTNLIAHSQHYYWNTSKHYIIDFNILLVEQMLSHANKYYDEVVVFNGLSQDYSGDKEEWHSWVPKGGWEHYVKSILKLNCDVRPCMSYDANLYFTSREDIDGAESYLRNFKLIKTGDAFFFIERNSDNPLNLFIRLQHFGKGSEFYGNDLFKSLISLHFDLAAIRTGRHQQYSVAFGDVKGLNGSEGLANPKAAGLYAL